MLNNLFDPKQDKELILDQYKHFVDTAEAVTDRRLKANVFFISIHSLILSLIGVLKVDEEFDTVTIGTLVFLGTILSILWFVYINSFKQLNKLKFKVIHDMEKFVPFNSYESEWEYDKKSNEKYIRLSFIEKVIPFFIVIVYIGVFIIKLVFK